MFGPVSAHHFLQEVERQRVDGATVSAGHGLGHAHGVEDRLFGCLAAAWKRLVIASGASIFTLLILSFWPI